MPIFRRNINLVGLLSELPSPIVGNYWTGQNQLARLTEVWTLVLVTVLFSVNLICFSKFLHAWFTFKFRESYVCHSVTTVFLIPKFSIMFYLTKQLWVMCFSRDIRPSTNFLITFFYFNDTCAKFTSKVLFHGAMVSSVFAFILSCQVM